MVSENKWSITLSPLSPSSKTCKLPNPNQKDTCVWGGCGYICVCVQFLYNHHIYMRKVWARVLNHEGTLSLVIVTQVAQSMRGTQMCLGSCQVCFHTYVCPDSIHLAECSVSLAVLNVISLERSSLLAWGEASSPTVRSPGTQCFPSDSPFHMSRTSPCPAALSAPSGDCPGLSNCYCVSTAWECTWHI